MCHKLDKERITSPKTYSSSSNILIAKWICDIEIKVYTKREPGGYKILA
jgi:hypothetical protein